MRSMTGFGRGEARQHQIHVTAEVRAVNQRFLDVKLNLPRGWGEYEAEIRKLVQGVVARGRVEVMVRCVAAKPASTRLKVNEEFARTYVRALRRLGRSLGLEDRLSVEALLQRPEIFLVTEPEQEPLLSAKLGLKAVARALKALDAERNREGRALRRDLATRLGRLSAALPRLENLAAQARAQIAANFHARVRELLNDLPVDERRLFDETASTAQQGDISEEVTRLEAHLEALGAFLGHTGPVGKSIEFLLQEISREVNTIGAKSQSTALAQLAVGLKGEVEKMREQVQNIE